HNPLSPESPEAGVQHRRRMAGGTWTGAVSGRTVTAYASGVMEVQVATRVAGSGWSQWSDPFPIAVRSRPGPTLHSPTNGSVITGPLVPLSWGMGLQTEWEAELSQGGELVSAMSGTTEKQAVVEVEDNSSYTLRWRGFDGYLWSQW